MGIFENSTFKSKEMETFYKHIKEKQLQFLSNGHISATEEQLHKSIKVLKSSLVQLSNEESQYVLDLPKELHILTLISVIKTLCEGKDQLSVTKLILNGYQSAGDENWMELLIDKLSLLLKSKNELLELTIGFSMKAVHCSKLLQALKVSSTSVLEQFQIKQVVEVSDEFIKSVISLLRPPKEVTSQESLKKSTNELLTTATTGNDSIRSLKRIELISDSYSQQQMHLLSSLLNLNPRLFTFKIHPQQENQNNEFFLKWKEREERNQLVNQVLDDVIKQAGKRQFRSKLDTFRKSVKDHKVKGNQPLENNQPVYKWLAQSMQENQTQPADPYHPIVYASKDFKAGYALSIGRRTEMQDVLSMRGQFSSNSQASEGWWAIFDGHGGREAANYASEHLHQHMLQEFEKISNWSDEACQKAIERAFWKCQNEMSAWNTITGTTVVGLYIRDSKRYIVNLGDSRCILFNSKNQSASLMTKDHRPIEEKEKQRILQSGGFIENGRVNGKLQVSRSLGDSELSKVVSCLPDVYCGEISDSDEFCVLASDGLWDVFSGTGDNEGEKHDIHLNQNLEKWNAGMSEVTQLILDSETPSKAAKKLCELAYKRGSQDNISVIVIFLKYKGKQKDDDGSSLSGNRVSVMIQEGGSQENTMKRKMQNPLFGTMKLKDVKHSLEALQMMNEVEIGQSKKRLDSALSANDLGQSKKRLDSPASQVSVTVTDQSKKKLEQQTSVPDVIQSKKKLESPSVTTTLPEANQKKIITTTTANTAINTANNTANTNTATAEKPANEKQEKPANEKHEKLINDGKNNEKSPLYKSFSSVFKSSTLKKSQSNLHHPNTNTSSPLKADSVPRLLPQQNTGTGISSGTGINGGDMKLNHGLTEQRLSPSLQTMVRNLETRNISEIAESQDILKDGSEKGGAAGESSSEKGDRGIAESFVNEMMMVLDRTMKLDLDK